MLCSNKGENKSECKSCYIKVCCKETLVDVVRLIMNNYSQLERTKTALK